MEKRWNFITASEQSGKTVIAVRGNKWMVTGFTVSQVTVEIVDEEFGEAGKC